MWMCTRTTDYNKYNHRNRMADENFAGPMGGGGQDGPAPNVDNLGGGGGAGGEGADDINQYYDDAGETFLPADHVSNRRQE